MANNPADPTRLAENPAVYRLLGTAPPVMSVMALAMCVLAATGVVSDRPGDEGAMAHLYQLIIVMEAPVICMFAPLAVRRGSCRNLTALAVQLTLFIVALAAVPALGL